MSESTPGNPRRDFVRRVFPGIDSMDPKFLTVGLMILVVLVAWACVSRGVVGLQTLADVGWWCFAVVVFWAGFRMEAAKRRGDWSKSRETRYAVALLFCCLVLVALTVTAMYVEV